MLLIRYHTPWYIDAVKLFVLEVFLLFFFFCNHDVLVSLQCVWMFAVEQGPKDESVDIVSVGDIHNSETSASAS